MRSKCSNCLRFVLLLIVTVHTKSDTSNQNNTTDILFVEKETNLSPSNGVRLLVGGVYGTLASVGIFGYALFLHSFVRIYTTELSKHTFYVLVEQLAVADITFLFTIIAVVVPYTITGWKIDSWLVNAIFCGVSTACYMAVGVTSLCMALNRFSCFTSPRLEEYLFTRPNIHRLCVAIWAYAVVCFTLTTFFGCAKDYDTERFVYTFICAENTAVVIKYFTRFLPVTPMICAVFILAIYAALVAYLRFFIGSVFKNSTDEDQRKLRLKRERNLLIQGALVGGTLLGVFLWYNLVLKIFASNHLTEIQASVLFMCGTIVNCSLSPVIFIAFNQSIRLQFLSIFNLGRSNEAAAIPHMSYTPQRGGVISVIHV